jgi:predicted DNA-binding protein
MARLKIGETNGVRTSVLDGILEGMASTTIKVPVELRDRLAALASRESTTLAGAIARSLDAAESAAFWADVARTMGTTGVGSSASSDVEQLSGSLTDGLDPEESWDDVW